MVPVLTKDAAVLWRQLAGRHQPCEYPLGAVWSLNADTTKTNEPHNARSSTTSREWASRPSGSRPLPANFTRTRATARRTMATGSRTCKAIVHERTSVVLSYCKPPLTFQIHCQLPVGHLQRLAGLVQRPARARHVPHGGCCRQRHGKFGDSKPTSWSRDDCNGREGNTCSTVLLTHSGL